jgi:subtilase family serine protease
MSFNFAKRLWPSRSLNRRCSRNPRTNRLSLEQLEHRLVPSASGIDPNLALAPKIAPQSTPACSGIHATPQSSPAVSGFTPSQIRQAYGFNNISFWNPSLNAVVPGDGSGQTIAIVDAFDDPNLASDLDTFDQTFGLTSSNSPTLYQQYGAASSFLTKVNQTGGTK